MLSLLAASLPVQAGVGDHDLPLLRYPPAMAPPIWADEQGRSADVSLPAVRPNGAGAVQPRNHEAMKGLGEPQG